MQTPPRIQLWGKPVIGLKASGINRNSRQSISIPQRYVDSLKHRPRADSRLVRGTEQCQIQNLKSHVPRFASAMIATSLTMILLGLLCQGLFRLFYHSCNQIAPTAALTIRVWYLFPKYPLIRTSVVSAYVSCTIATCVVIGLSEKYIYADTHSTTVNQDGASVIAAIYIPFLVLDIFLFVLKVYMLATSPAYMKRDTFVSRFMKEYALIYTSCATLSSLNYTGVW